MSSKRGLTTPAGSAKGPAAVTLAEARRAYDAAVAAAEVAWDRLEVSPDTLEYQIEWSVLRREEATAAWRLRQAVEAYRRTDGDPSPPARR